jgi:hypothetical protein
MALDPIAARPPPIITKAARKGERRVASSDIFALEKVRMNVHSHFRSANTRVRVSDITNTLSTLPSPQRIPI